MKPDAFDQIDNRETYRAAMDHLSLPQDFERRTLELAEQKAAQLQERQAARDAWKAKPLYRRPAAQVCFALLFVFVLSTLFILPMGLNESAPMATPEMARMEALPDTQEELDGTSFYSAPGVELYSGKITPEKSANDATENRKEFTQEAGDQLDGGTAEPKEEQSALESGPSVEYRSAGGSSEVPPPAARGVKPQAPVQNDAMPLIGAALRLEAPLASASGSAFGYQPGGKTIQFWNGSVLTDTGIAGADSLLAAPDSFYYTAANKLYHVTNGKNAALLRDFSSEALLPNQKFTVHLFGRSGAYLYLYANSSEPWKETLPYTILRVSTDGKTEKILFSADGKTAGGTVSQAVLSGNTLYYSLSGGGFYALNANGGVARWLSSNTTAEPFYVWKNELLYLDAENYLCSIQTDGSGGERLTGEAAISNIALLGDVVYFMLGPDAHSTEGNSLYALDLNRGAISQVWDGAEDFRRLYPASDHLFLTTSDGTAYRYSISTKELKQLG
ncbi:DUF5050 domain-containing protein [Anaeromassilibacillus senegalensis]|uniref:DUF5050 domain-containing protein n=1 Tax=Anaeromassilibacillus senegalensis TaxID=1673717 RepID=UPI0006834DF1|nr:DUF5050 domain-containing protein [Anaeromassilibacillus senegalensis]